MPAKTQLHSLTLDLPDEQSTRDFAQKLGRCLIPGDTLLLQGDIGMGKSFLARALIQSLQEHPEDIPSPTFTLVQVYETSAGEIWHSDLYRLGSPDEVIELGLTLAFDTAICLIEWPDRLGALTPADAMTLTLTHGTTDSARRLSLTGATPETLTRIGPAFDD